MLKCPSCGRAGGPFRLRQQAQADAQILRGWSCPCGETFHAAAGAERSADSQTMYSGFTVEWPGRPRNVTLRRIGKGDSVWTMEPWTFYVAGPPDGPGTRIITLLDRDQNALAEWRLQPGWGPGEIARRIKVCPPPSELPVEYLSRILVRFLG